MVFSVCNLYEKKYSPSTVVFCECYMCQSNKTFNNNNWGDDINKFFFEYASDVHVINLPFSKMLFMNNIDKYSLIGSILSFYKLDGKIVYGSGVMDPKAIIRGIPKKIISVRGPETRKVLLENGIACPPNYGDPALLLPCFYKPLIRKVGKGGLILNMGTEVAQPSFIKDIVNNHNLEVISMTQYTKWTDIIDRICSCDYIISESLHGLIVSETYGIPNVWVEFSNHPDYWEFKYKDYYESIGKDEKIIHIESADDFESVKPSITKWEKGKINYDDMLRLYPFKVESTTTR